MVDLLFVPFLLGLESLSVSGVQGCSEFGLLFVALLLVEGLHVLELFLEQLVLFIDFVHLEAKELDLLALLVELIKLSRLLFKFPPHVLYFQLMLLLQSLLQLIALLLPGCIVLLEPASQCLRPLDLLLPLDTAPHLCDLLLVA